MVADGELAAVRLRRVLRIDTRDLERLIERSK
jgi:hypothetical protein